MAQTSQPFWLHEPRYATLRTTEHLPLHAKVVIIGAGLTGVSTAYWLTQNGLSAGEVVVVEKRGICSGATGRNGGHLWPLSRSPTDEEVATFGLNQLKALYDFEYDTMEQMIELIKTRGIECDYCDTGAVVGSRFPVENEYAKQTIAKLKDLGWERGRLELWDSATCKQRLSTSFFCGGLFQAKAGQLWPAKFVWGLTDICLKCGVHFHTQTAVTAVEPLPSTSTHRFAVHTTRGTIAAHAVVYATNGYTATLLPHLKDIIVPVRGQVVTTLPLSSPPSAPRPGIVFNDGWEYAIQRARDGRLVFGGTRWRSSTGHEVGIDEDTSLCPEVSEGLRSLVDTVFNAWGGTKPLSAASIEFEWTGIMGFSPDERPLVGLIPPRPNATESLECHEENLTPEPVQQGVCVGEYIGAGYTGHGMPRCFGVGRILAEMITGKRAPTDVIKPFDSRRFHSYALKTEKP